MSSKSSSGAPTPSPTAAPVAEAASQNRELFRLMVESVRDYAIFVLDPGGHVATWNAGAERIKGYRAVEIIGQHFSVFYLDEDVRAGKCEHELEVAGSEGRFEDEGWRVRKDGSRFWANVVISAVRDENDVLIGFSKVTRDLTERRKGEEERAARLAAEQANHAKDEFLAMLGHELRNPLAPILTALQLMRMRGDGAPTREQQIIERQVNHMMHLVDDLLDVSRVTRGKLELKREPVDLEDVLTRALETASPLLEQRRHAVELQRPPAPLSLLGDEDRLVQVLTNLLTNAAKYTDMGGKVGVELRKEGNEAVIEVTDNGAGLAPELLPRVFELFVQGHQAPERSQGGLGLGLTLVRTLVGLHGGTVHAASAGIGAGSTFTVRLPLGAAADIVEARRARSIPPRLVAGKRVLVVDDNEDACELLADVLRATGHEVATATDAVSALDIARAFLPEIAVLDIGLPVMDGYELAERIRAERTAPLHLVALTGYGQPNDHERSRQAGFGAHLVKPIDIQKLVDTIENLPALAR